MASLQEFSKIVILKDTVETRFAFGPPIDENLLNTAQLGVKDDTTNPFYKRLKGGDMINGWRYLYPNFDNSLAPGSGLPDGLEGAFEGRWSSAVRNNILQTIGVEQGPSEPQGYEKPATASGTAIIFGDKLYVGDVGGDFDEETTFAIPNPVLAVGDFIFWGDDPNGLKIGGKIKTVYASGSPDYVDGARYQFDKPTKEATPVHASGTYIGDPIPQDIYYYRSSWNGKGMKNNLQISPNEPIGGGFYVLIKANGTSTNVTYPYLGFDAARAGSVAGNGVPNTSEERVIGNDLYAFTDLIRVRRISNKWKSDETENDTIGEEIIPCTIHRTSNFYYSDSGPTADYVTTTGVLNSLYNKASDGGFTLWLAYYINPYGGNNFKLDKNTTYVVEVNERLPAVVNFTNGQGIFDFAYKGSI